MKIIKSRVQQVKVIAIMLVTMNQLISKPASITIDGTHDGIVEVKIMNDEITKPLPKKSTPDKMEPVKALKVTESKPLPLLGDNGGIAWVLFQGQ
ncbi:hypothetical protein HCA69_10080 [Listeria grandensis]|uniref:Uncharacterized protein n=1 Tax=Listeria grandensis TaxID=1494963 RepID=A0A7X1CQ64_9LIST|nr:hypothetical protein [Listeria grandensis]MBC1936715.1 hypothetical protein [Listeria grandensis]